MSKRAYGRKELALSAVAAGLAAFSGAAQAISFSIPWGEDDSIEGVLNTTITIGAAMRMQDRSPHFVSKANLNPDVCGGQFQSCQGLFRTQTHPAERLASAAGAASPNFDDGNWNYDRYDLTQGVGKITQDLTLSYGNFGIFAKSLYFYDWVNNDFTEFHPNQINPENKAEAGTTDTLTGQRQYGPGFPVHSKRTGGEILKQAGTDLQFLDAYFYGTLPLPLERELTFKFGRQTLNWGESLLLALNSINQVNPINANNFYRVGFQVEEVFTPVGLAFLSTEPFYNATLELFYQYEWLPVEAPTPGTIFQLTDVVGTNSAVPYAHVHFGGGAEDPEGVGFPLFNPLSGVTNTTTKIDRLQDLEPQDGGQYGASLRYYAENLNNGTEIGFYYMNYHSRLPYASFFATGASCARREGNDQGLDAYDPISFLAACPDLPFTHDADPENATSNAVPLDDVKLLVEYPEDIQLYGMSFNTTWGEWSFQGEVAYRPNLPLQVDAEDLVFAAFGPTLSRCHDPNLVRTPLSQEQAGVGNALAGALFGPISAATGGQVGIPTLADPTSTGCSGTSSGLGSDPDGNEVVYGPSDFVIDADGTRGSFNDTFDLAIGHAVGSARSFPAFVIPYRGGIVGENTPCEKPVIGSTKNPNSPANPNFIPYTPANPCYIRGYERMDVYQFNLGGTYVMGATDNPIGADQILFVFETGATWVPDLPPLDQLQFEADGTYYHASAGADGSGADRSRQACSTLQGCSFGGDGLRFNPHQQDLKGFPDKLSWGYVLISLIRYESVFPGISFQPQIIWKHDVEGTAPGPGGNFVHGRKTMDIQWETRYKSNLAFYLGYTWFTGGGVYNIYRDKDQARAFVKLQF